MLSNVHLTECLKGHVCLCQSVWGYAYILIAFKHCKFTLWLSVCVCAHVFMTEDGYELRSHVPFASSRESDLWPPSLNTLASPLHSLCGYVWVCGCLCMFVALSQTHCMFELKLDCLHWVLFAYTGSIYSVVQMWHYASLFLFVHVYDTLCTHWAILWLQNQLVHTDLI